MSQLFSVQDISQKGADFYISRHCEELHPQTYLIPKTLYAILWQSTIVLPPY